MSLSIEEAEIVAEETLQNLTSRMFKLRVYAILLILLSGFVNGLNAYLFALPIDDYLVNIALVLPGVFSLLFAYTNFNLLAKDGVERNHRLSVYCRYTQNRKIWFHTCFKALTHFLILI